MELAEIDLRLRGPGEIYGTKQHGFPDLKIASFADLDLIEQTRKAADSLLASNFSFLENDNSPLNIKLKKYKIIYPLDNNAHVVSLPCSNFRELYRQKKRWGVGGLKSPLRGYLVMASGFFTHIGIIVSPFFFNWNVLGLIIFKLLADFIFLFYPLQKLRITKSLKYFFTFEIYYIIYVVLLPFVVIFNRRVKWKGREF